MKNNVEQQLSEYIIEHRESFYKIAYSYTRNKEDALDVVQDAICKALSSVHKLREPQYMKTWFYRILVHTAIDFLRKNKKYVLTEEGTSGREVKVWDKYENIDLQKALDCLTPDQRMVITLRYFEDLKIQQVADMLNENVSTIKTRLYAALKKLKIQVEDEENAHERT